MNEPVEEARSEKEGAQRPIPPSEEDPQYITERELGAVVNEVTQEASDPESVSSRNRLREIHGNLFDGTVNVDGTFVSRDQFNVGIRVGDANEPVICAIGRPNLGEAFVPPAGLERLITWFERTRRVLVLRGPTGYGRTTAALAAMHGCGSTRFFRLGGFADLGKFRQEHLVFGAAYLLTDVADTDARKLSPGVLKSLNELLVHADARMVIIVSEHSGITDDEVMGYLHDFAEPADPNMVFERRHAQLSAKAGNGDDRNGGIAELARELLGETVNIARGVRLAELFHQEWDGTSQGRERITTRAAEAEDQDFAEWFDNLEDLELRCYAITLAVLEGLPYGYVSEQAEVLRDRFEQLLSPEGESPKDHEELCRNPFARNRDERLRALRSGLSITTMPTRYGEFPTEVSGFSNRRYAVSVLERNWRQYDRSRDIILIWLRDLGVHYSTSVRIWTAEAVGRLLTIDFDTVLNRVVTAWAASTDRSRHEVAAIALEEPMAAGHVDQVKAVLEGWRRANNANFNTAAARACGASVGRSDPDWALGEFKALFRSKNFQVIRQIGRAMADLVDHDHSLASRILDTVLMWNQSGNPEERTRGQLVFLIIASETVIKVQPAHEDGPQATWPLLLWLAEARLDVKASVVTLWQAALHGPTLNELARTVLTQWARTVEPHGISRLALVRMCGEIVLRSHERFAARSERIIRRLAAEWSRTTLNESPKAPESAADLGSYLSRMNEPRKVLKNVDLAQ